MNARQEATCRHCGKPVERCEGPAPGVGCGYGGWVHTDTHGHYCDEAVRGTVAETARATVAEPGGSES